MVNHPRHEVVSRSTGLPAAVGETEDGRTIFAVDEFLDDMTVLPVSAYTIQE